MGDHRAAGYLKAEQDPAFAASAASTVSTTDVTNWDTAYDWGDHAKAGVHLHQPWHRAQRGGG